MSSVVPVIVDILLCVFMFSHLTVTVDYRSPLNKSTTNRNLAVSFWMETLAIRIGDGRRKSSADDQDEDHSDRSDLISSRWVLLAHGQRIPTGRRFRSKDVRWLAVSLILSHELGVSRAKCQQTIGTSYIYIYILIILYSMLNLMLLLFLVFSLSVSLQWFKAAQFQTRSSALGPSYYFLFDLRMGRPLYHRPGRPDPGSHQKSTQ